MYRGNDMHYLIGLISGAAIGAVIGYIGKCSSSA